MPETDIRFDVISLAKANLERVPFVKESEQITSSKDTKLAQKVFFRPYNPLDLLGTLELNVYHARSVAFKATATAGLGFAIKKVGAEEPYPEDETRAKYPWLYKTNDRDESFTEVMVRSMMDKETIGDGWIEPARTLGGAIETIYGFPGETGWIEREGKTTTIGGYVQKVENRYKRFRKFGAKPDSARKGELIRFKNPMIGNLYYGIPDYIAAIRAMALRRAGDDFNYAFFKNGAIPSWAFIATGVDLTNKQKKKMSEFFSSQYGGADNWNKLLLLQFSNENVKINFERITAKIEDMSFEKLFDKTTLEIISAHGVPPRIVGIITAGSLGGGGEYQAQLKTFKEVLIRPKQVLVEETLNNTLFAETGDRIDFNEIDITPIAPAEPEDTEDAIFAAGAFSAEERGAEIVKALLAIRKQLIENGVLDEFNAILDSD